ncbi:MAG: TIR domain-containing protein [Gemmatimonadales bacterium]
MHVKLGPASGLGSVLESVVGESDGPPVRVREHPADDLGGAAFHAIDGTPMLPSAGEARRFDVALSFPGEIRDTVEQVAVQLASKLGKQRVFYDAFHEAKLARFGLDEHLQRIYQDESQLVVVFVCAEYENKEWPVLEWRAVRELIKRREDERVFLLRLDETEIPCVLSIDGYIDGQDRTAGELAELILDRLQQLHEGG